MSSQYGQDEFVLAVLNGLRGGFFLDSGASDGVEASNTYLLERAYGWAGICVEPNTDLYARLVTNRRCRCVNCCLYDRDATVDFVEAGTIGGILDEYDPVLLGYARRLLRTPADGTPPTVPKPAHTVRSVLRRYQAPPVIDYWSLDTEGSELAILRSFPFAEYQVRVITVEHNWLPVRAEVRRFLESQGFVWAEERGCDDCFVYPAATCGWSSTAGGTRAWSSAAWRRRG